MVSTYPFSSFRISAPSQDTDYTWQNVTTLENGTEAFESFISQHISNLNRVDEMTISCDDDHPRLRSSKNGLGGAGFCIKKIEAKKAEVFIL